jgi:diketogulonate reductase-like aldo/keto reductase
MARSKLALYRQKRDFTKTGEPSGEAKIAPAAYPRFVIQKHAATRLSVLERKPLPEWARDTGAATWPQFLLKFIASHPAITCAIPATTRVDHVRENMVAATGVLPDESLRARMAAYVRQV